MAVVTRPDSMPEVCHDGPHCPTDGYLTTQPATSHLELRPHSLSPKHGLKGCRRGSKCGSYSTAGSVALVQPSAVLRRRSRPDHANLYRPENRLHALGAIRSEAVAEIRRASSGIVTENPEKGLAIADGQIEQALTDAGAPVCPPDVDGVQREADLDAHFFGGARCGETDHLWPLDRKPHHTTAGDELAPQLEEPVDDAGLGEPAGVAAVCLRPALQVTVGSARDILQRRRPIRSPSRTLMVPGTILPETSPLDHGGKALRAAGQRQRPGRSPAGFRWRPASGSGEVSSSRVPMVEPDHPQRFEEDLGQLGLGRVVAGRRAADHQRAARASGR